MSSGMATNRPMIILDVVFIKLDLLFLFIDILAIHLAHLVWRNVE